MHTVHMADNAELAKESGFGFAAMGIIFSVKDYNVKLNQRE